MSRRLSLLGRHHCGQLLRPTVLDCIAPDMLIAREETFGPVAGATGFGSEDEAGVIGANDGSPSLPGAPFGGVKASGYGREGGSVGIDEYLDVKYVSVGGTVDPDHEESST